jgi:hypothetical protein
MGGSGQRTALICRHGSSGASPRKHSGTGAYSRFTVRSTGIRERQTRARAFRPHSPEFEQVTAEFDNKVAAKASEALDLPQHSVHQTNFINDSENQTENLICS